MFYRAAPVTFVSTCRKVRGQPPLRRVGVYRFWGAIGEARGGHTLCQINCLCAKSRGTSLRAIWCSMLAEVSGAGLNSVSDDQDERAPQNLFFYRAIFVRQSSKLRMG